MKIYISSSWKNRERVRNMALELRQQGNEVYDFTDPNCRTTPEIPPEKFPEEYDPEKHNYREYINRPEWQAAVMENKKAIEWADLIILLLPCGNDSHADWALGVGMGKKSVVVGSPRKGERSPVHMWANAILDAEEQLLEFITTDAKQLDEPQADEPSTEECGELISAGCCKANVSGDCDQDCEGARERHKSQSHTNGDCIRAMSDEDLAGFLDEISAGLNKCRHCSKYNAPYGDCRFTRKQSIADYLKSEVKENG